MGVRVRGGVALGVEGKVAKQCHSQLPAAPFPAWAPSDLLMPGAKRIQQR